MQAQAHVRTLYEGQLQVEVRAPHVEPVGIIEHDRIPVGAGQGHRHQVTDTDPRFQQIDLTGGVAVHQGGRRLHPERLLHGVGYEVPVVGDRGQLGRIADQVGEGVRGILEKLGDADPGDVGTGHRLSEAILDAVAYEGGNTHTGTTAEEAIAGGTGVCQDHAHIFCSAARVLGLPARYVSGYLMMNDRVEQDASHAWAEAFFEGLGWVGFDISNGYSPDERYIRVATGIDFREAAPINGMRMGGSGEGVLVSLRVEQ